MLLGFMLLFMLPVYSNGTVCNREMKQGPFKLKAFEPLNLNISRLSLKVERVSSYSPKVRMVTGYRSYWRSYCYQGGPLDPNTGCLDGLFSVPPTQAELKEWEIKSECSVGKDFSDSWGSDARACFSDPDFQYWHKRKELTRESTNKHFAYHTCSLSWRCGVSKSDLQLFLVPDSQNNLATNLLLPNSTFVPFTENEVFWSQGEFSYFVKGSPKLVREKMELGCFYEQGIEGPVDIYYCVDKELNLMFPVNASQNYYCDKTVCYLYSVLENRSHGGKVLPNLRGKHPYFNSIHEGDWMTHAASLQDLREVVNAQFYEIETLRYNLALVDDRFSKFTDLFNKLVTSVSKIDDRLIGKLISEEAASKYLSEDMFVLYPCAEPEPYKSNCHGDLIFTDGRWVKNEDVSKCVKLSAFKLLDFYNFASLWMPSITVPQLDGLIQDLEGWSFVAASRKGLEDTMMYTHNGGKGTSLEDVLNYPAGWVDNQLHGLLFGGILNFVILTLIVLLIVFLFKKVLC